MTPEHRALRSRANLRALATPERAARRLEVARRFRAGESIKAIAAALGIDRTTVTKDLQRIAPDALVEYRRKLAAKAVERRRRDALILRARGAGHTLETVATAAHVTLQRVQQIHDRHRRTLVEVEDDDDQDMS